MTDLQPGSVFAGYRIEDLAGRGGMGVVYRATDPGLERSVALKLISTELSGDAGFRRRFEAESKIAASLDHPNVIPIFHAGEQDGVLYLVMRCVEGEDLGEEIAEQGSLTPDRAVHVIAQVASALDAAHSRGLVHRDVKPANILLAAGDHAYLTDFGLTKRLLADSEQTATGDLLGTLDYVAPEQIRGAEVGPRTDVYALGCVLFHTLTGEAPFATLEREGKLWAHVSEPPPPLGPDLPPGLDRAIARAMAKDPADRFDSAGELAAAASEALAERGNAAALAVAPLAAAAGGAAAVPRLPLSRRDYRRALAIHALLAPFSLAVLGGTLLAALIFGLLPIAIPLALLLYIAAAAVTCFDQEVQQQVLERERGKRGEAPPGLPPAGSQPGIDETPHSPRIAALLERAAEKQARINDAIERAELPYAEVSEEVDSLIATIRQIAAGAELLEEGLRDAPPQGIAARLDELEAENDPARAELIEALRAQLAVQRRLEHQLDLFYARMEEILVEFDTIRGQLVSLSASTDAGNQRHLAERVHDLRDQAGSIAEGMATAYADPDQPVETERQ